MPIGVEQWRAQIGMFFASRMPRALVASKGAKYRRIHWTLQLLYLCLALVQLLFQIIDTGQQKLKKSVREWTAQLNTSSVFQHLPTYGNGGKKGLSLLATCLIVVQILLLIAGDVERNPGPLTGQGKKTREYCTIQKQFPTITEALAAQVDPATFAEKLQISGLVTSDVVEQARAVRVYTPIERIRHVVVAVQAHVQLQPSTYHDFIHVIQDAYPALAKELMKFYETDLEMNAPSVLSEVSDWKSLGNNLGVDPGKLTELEQSGGDLQHCKEEMLKEWVKTDRRASWRKLFRVLDQMGEDVAERVKDSYMEDSGQDAVPDEHSEQKKDDVEVMKEIRSLESRFEDLSFAIRKEMEKDQVSPERFQHSLTLLPESIRPDHIQFLRDNLSDISSAGSIGELFMYLNLYWNMFDYALLEHIIERFGSDQLQKRMDKYMHDLAQFRRTTKLGQFIKYWPGRAEPPPHFSEVKVHLTKNPMEYTLEEVEQLRRNICIEYRLKPFMLMIAKVKQSSIIIVWHIPSVLVSDLSDAILDTHSSFFEYHGIVEIEVDGVCVLDIQQKDVEMEDFEQQKLSSKHVKRKRKALEEMEWHPQFKKPKREQDWKEAAQDVNTELGHQLPKPRDDEGLLDELQMETSVLEEEEQVQRMREKPESCLQKVMEDTKAVVEHKEKQLQWERREKEATEQLLKAKMEELELKRKQEHGDHEKLLAALSQRRAQVNLERGQKEQLQRQLDDLHIILKEKEELAQEAELKRKQEQEERGYERDLQQQRVKELEEQLKELHREKEDIVQKLSEQMEWQQVLLEKRQLTETTHEKEPKLTSLGEKLEETTEHQPKPKMEQQVSLEKRQLTTHEKGAPLPDWLNQLSRRNALLINITISDVEAEAVLQNLRINTTVEILEFDNVRFSANGLGTVLVALRENKSVKTLRLGGISILDSDADVFARNLRENYTIGTINLIGVNISDVGFSSLTDAIRHHQSLTILDLWETKISDSGANALACALQENKILQELMVDFQSVSNGGAREFAMNMERWGSSLKTLKIWDTENISEEVKEMLSETARRKAIELSLYNMYH